MYEEYQYNPNDFDYPVKEDMENVYEAIRQRDKEAYIYHLGNLFYSLKHLGTFNVIPMSKIREMQDYFGGLYD